MSGWASYGDRDIAPDGAEVTDAAGVPPPVPTTEALEAARDFLDSLEDAQLDAEKLKEGQRLKPVTDYGLERLVQIEEAVEAVRQVEGIEDSVWKSLDASERLNVLQSIEAKVAEVQGRPAVPVVAGTLDEGTFGAYNPKTKTITVNAEHLKADLPADDFVDTIIHEGRHAYQDFAIEHPDCGEDPEVIKGWADNAVPGQYLDPETYGLEWYQSQPLEADAWDYASQFMESWKRKS
jgi:hypothetical protein